MDYISLFIPGESKSKSIFVALLFLPYDVADIVVPARCPCSAN